MWYHMRYRRDMIETTASEQDFADLADAYQANVVALRARKITLDEHRAENHRLRESTDEHTWNLVKVAVLEHRNIGTLAD